MSAPQEERRFLVVSLPRSHADTRATASRSECSCQQRSIALWLTPPDPNSAGLRGAPVHTSQSAPAIQAIAQDSKLSRLGQVVIHPCGENLISSTGDNIGGQGDDDNLLPEVLLLPNLHRGFQAAHHWHVAVHQDDVWLVRKRTS